MQWETINGINAAANLTLVFLSDYIYLSLFNPSDCICQPFPTFRYIADLQFRIHSQGT